ncbi:uncharacterized protein V2V93DRAFT_52620 [Kockiozyma suomiensis]|uniref:uncharacterized protein n=1 Tax=Kockiozyma suomiensis TaxID=1337062 RepID=UPI0033433519
MSEDNRLLIYRSSNNNWRRRDQSRSNYPQQQPQQQQPPSQHKPAQQFTSVRGFNSREVEEYLNKGYSASLVQARAGGDEKTIIYSADGKGWTSTTPKGSAWGQRPHLTAKGTTVLTELRHGLQNLQG